MPSNLNQFLQLLAINREILAIDEAWLHSYLVSEEFRAASLSRQQEKAIAKSSGGVAVVPIRGPITAQKSVLEMIFGISFSANVDTISQSIRAALADETTKALILEFDSPGGTVSGVPELADEIRAQRGAKPIVAFVHYNCSSAAYWLAAQADEIIASPSAMVGSIGAFIAHMDRSKQMEQEGIAVEFITSDPRKVDGNPFEPLSETGRAQYQAIVEQGWNTMATQIAKGRGVSAAVVKGDSYGKGHVFTASDALERGMVDKIRTFAEVLEAYGVSRGSPARARAERELELMALQYQP